MLTLMQPIKQPVVTPHHDPYDFIVNPAKAPKKSFLSGGSKPKKILMAVGILTVIVMLLAVVASVTGGTNSKDDYTKLLQQHAELIRVAALGEKSAKDTPAKNLAITTRLTLESQQATINSLAISSGIKKIDNKVVALGKDTATDKKLTDAGQVNRFDEVFIAILNDQLAAYQTTLKKVYDSSKSNSSKDKLSTLYDYATLLVNEAKAQSKTGSTDSTPATN